jgi:hypothetical protein
MLITWLPFENCEESFVYYNPTQYLTLNTKEKRLSSYAMSKLVNSSNSNKPAMVTSTIKQNTITEVEITHPEEELPQNESEYSSSSSCNSSIKPNTIESLITQQDNEKRNSCISTSSCSSEDAYSTSTDSLHNDDQNALEMIKPHVQQVLDQLMDQIQSDHETISSKISSNQKLDENRFQMLEKLFLKLQSKLDDLRAFYIELNDLNELVQMFDKLFERIFSRSANDEEEFAVDDENMSMTVNNVLHYFDFLDDPENDSELPSRKTSVISLSLNENEISKSDSFTNQFHNHESLSYLCDFDSVLMVHFENCISLLNHLAYINSSTILPSQLEAIVFDKLNVEIQILQSVFLTLKNLDTTTKVDTLICDMLGQAKSAIWLGKAAGTFTTDLELVLNDTLESKLIVSFFNDLIKVKTDGSKLTIFYLKYVLDNLNEMSENQILSENIEEKDLLIGDYVYSTRYEACFKLENVRLNKIILCDLMLSNLEVESDFSQKLDHFISRMRSVSHETTNFVINTILLEHLIDGKYLHSNVKNFIEFLQNHQTKSQEPSKLMDLIIEKYAI